MDEFNPALKEKERKILMQCHRFVVGEPPIIKLTNKTLAANHEIKTFFISKQGNSSAEVTFEKDCYNFNETVVAKCKVDNSACEKDLTEVSFQLKQFIEGNNGKNDLRRKDRNVSLVCYR